MLKLIKNNTDSFSNLEEECITGKSHVLRSFFYECKESNFEKVCIICRGYKISRNYVETNFNPIDSYFNSERYFVLRRYQ